MRRYRTTSWILLILSIINVTLGAPIAGRDINGVRANGVDVDKDMTAALQKRMDSDDDQPSDLTSEHGSPSGYAIPELEQESESESESELESESETMMFVLGEGMGFKAGRKRKKEEEEVGNS